MKSQCSMAFYFAKAFDFFDMPEGAGLQCLNYGGLRLVRPRVND